MLLILRAAGFQLLDSLFVDDPRRLATGIFVEDDVSILFDKHAFRKRAIQRVEGVLPRLVRSVPAEAIKEYPRSSRSCSRP